MGVKAHWPVANIMNKQPNRLTSRKFWLTVLGGIAILWIDLEPLYQATLVMGLLGSYNIGNGLQKR